MRPSKSEKFKVEQFLIRQDIITLLNLKDSGFYLCDLDHDQCKQNHIMDLAPEISEYFTHVNVTGILYPDKCKRPWLSLVRGVLKNKYRLKYKACRRMTKNGSVFTMKYFIESLDQSNTCKYLKRLESNDSLDGSSLDSNFSESNSSDNENNDRLTLKIKKRKNKLKLTLRSKSKNINKKY